MNTCVCGLATRMWRIVSVLVLVGVATAGFDLFRQDVHIRRGELNDVQRIEVGTVDSHWVALTYFTQVYRSDKTKDYEIEAARAGLRKAEAVIFDRWARNMEQQYSFIRYRDGRLMIDRGAATTAAPEELNAASADLAAGVTVNPDLQTCWNFAWIRNLSADEAFPTWFRNTQHRLGGTYPDTLAALRTDIDGVVQARFQDVLERVDGLIAAKDFEKAFEALQAVHGRWQDVAPQGVLDQRLTRVSTTIIGHKLEQIRERGFDTTESNQTAARALADLRRECESNPFMRSAWSSQETQRDVRSLQEDIGASRARALEGDMQQLAEKNHYWAMYQFARKQLNEAEGLDEAVREGLVRGVTRQYTALLPAAGQYLIRVAEQEVEEAERHGTVVVLCQMVREMMDYGAEIAGALPEECTQVMEQVARLERAAQKNLSYLVRRSIMLDEFRPEDGLGTEFRQDLEIGLRDALQDCPLIYGVALKPYSDNADATDYVVTDGIVGAIRASHNPSVQTTEVIRVPGRVVETDNPVFQQAMAEGRGVPPGTPARIHVQEVHVYVVRNEVTEGFALARIRFTVVHQGQRALQAIELREGLSKAFVQQSIDPLKTTVEEVPHDGPAAPAPGPTEPALRRDDLWSELRLEEWARTEARQLAMMRILGFVARFPLDLTQRARTYEGSEDWRLAANDWGICLEYLRNIQTGPDVRHPLFWSTNPPPYMRADYQQNAGLQEHLDRLKKGQVWDAAVQTVLHFLER